MNTMQDVKPKILVTFTTDKNGCLVPETVCQISRTENRRLAEWAERIERVLFGEGEGIKPMHIV
jgi:hypothetical protein